MVFCIENRLIIATSITGRQVDPLEFAQVLSNLDDKNIHSDTIVLTFGCFSTGKAIPDYVSDNSFNLYIRQKKQSQFLIIQ